MVSFGLHRFFYTTSRYSTGAAVHQLAGEPVAKGQGGGAHDADGAAGPVRVLGVSLLILIWTLHKI